MKLWQKIRRAIHVARSYTADEEPRRWPYPCTIIELPGDEQEKPGWIIANDADELVIEAGRLLEELILERAAMTAEPDKHGTPVIQCSDVQAVLDVHFPELKGGDA